MELLSVAAARQKDAIGKLVQLRGWIRTRRDSNGGFSFLELNDGSCQSDLQIIADANHVATNKAYMYRPHMADWMADQLGAQAQGGPA